MAFLHGVETIELKQGAITVQAVRSAVIGVVGIAPRGALNTLTLVQNQTDAAQFGGQVPGFSIPVALDSILKQGNATILVVNVFNNATMTTTVTAEATVAVANRATKLAFAPVGATPPVVKDVTDTTTYVAGTDYTIDEFGNITILAAIGTIAEGAVLHVTYAKLNAAAVTASVINGSIDGTTFARTGFKCFVDSYNLFGFKPKILISPGYSSLTAVSTQMIVEATTYKAMALIDAPAATTVGVAVAGRGPSGAINFYTSSERAILLFPQLKRVNPVSNANENVPYSQFFAGVMAAQDNTNGYWFSPSNVSIQGIIGLETNISGAINDPNTDANLLNSNGITTVMNSFGTGFRTWGNRSAAFPSSTAPKNFISIRRTADIVHESIELAMLDYIDQPITNGLIDSIRETANSFIRTLIGRGGLVAGSNCTFDPSLNPPSQIAAGQLVFSLNFMGPVPGERLTFNSFVDINLLKNLLTTQ